ncbi:hypothetical protein FHU30_007579 [Actinomadura rupiterrae]|nr:hypothetical protein [Actinomadura rupiterrae]
MTAPATPLQPTPIEGYIRIGETLQADEVAKDLATLPADPPPALSDAEPDRLRTRLAAPCSHRDGRPPEA